MIRKLALMTALLGLGSATAIAEPEHDAAVLEQFFSNLEGKWQCEGGTAKGKETAASISFMPDPTGKIYTYTQIGTKGHTNTLTGTWAFDAPMKNLVVSRRYISPDGVYSDMFLGDTWTATSLTLDAKALWLDLWAENRFLYEIHEDGKFKVTWEVQRDGTWKMGDYLLCDK